MIGVEVVEVMENSNLDSERSRPESDP